MNRVFDSKLILTISFFEALTKARLHDCFEDANGTMFFVVEPFELGRALGPRAANVEKLQRKLNKKIKVVEFNPELIGFVTNLCYPNKVKQIEEKEGTVIITPDDTKSRGFLIGRAASNLRNMETIVKRYFTLKEIKVI